MATADEKNDDTGSAITGWTKSGIVAGVCYFDDVAVAEADIW